MKIQEYIQKHNLTERDLSGHGVWTPMALMPPDDGKLKVFANDTATHIVAIDETQNKFKIVHYEMVHLATGWMDGSMNYETDARPFWTQP
jgi:hypothetical protein